MLRWLGGGRSQGCSNHDQASDADDGYSPVKGRVFVQGLGKAFNGVAPEGGEVGGDLGDAAHALPTVALAIAERAEAFSADIRGDHSLNGPAISAFSL